MIKPLTFVLCLAAWAVSGQTTAHFFKNYTYRNGLPTNEVYSTTVDKQGNIWFGSTLGLTRFDGYDFFNYQKEDGSSGLASNLISDLVMAHDGKIWIGYDDGGIDLFDPNLNRVVWHLGKETEKAALLDNNILTLYAEGDSLLFISTRRYNLEVLNLKDTTISTVEILPSLAKKNKFIQYVNQIQPGENHTFWLSTLCGLVKWDRKHHTFHYLPENNDASQIHQVGSYTSILPDGDTGLYIGTWGRGLLYYQTQKKEWSFFEKNEQGFHLEENTFRKLARRSNTSIWVLSRNEGLGYFDRETNAFTFPVFDPLNPNSPPKAIYSDMCLDGLGGVWTTHSGGVSSFHEQNQFVEKLLFPPDVPVQRLENVPQTLFRDGSRLWFGRNGSNFLMYWDESQQTFHKKCKLPENTSVRKIIPYKDGVFLATLNHGLLWVPQLNANESSAKRIAGPVSSLMIYDAVLHSNGKLYLATFSNGLVEFNPETESMNAFLPEDAGVHIKEVPRGVISLLVDANDDIWCIGLHGVMRLRIKEGIFESIYQTDSPYKAALQDIKKIEQTTTGDILVLTMNAGIFVFESGKPMQVKAVYDHTNYLNAAINYTFVVTQSNQLIVANTYGLQVLSEDLTKSFVLSYENGLLSSDIFLRILADNNQIYLPKAGIMYRIALPKINKRGLDRTQVSISQIQKLDGTPILFDNTSKIVLPHDENAVNILLTTHYYPTPEQVQLAYAFDEKATDWKAIQGNKLTLVNLESNQYPLWVKAKQPDGTWGLPQQLVQFSVLPIFYQTWWFRLIVFLLVSGTLIFIYNLRVSYLIKNKQVEGLYQKQLAEAKLEGLRAQMNPHFLFNSLNAINFFILKGKIEEASGYLVMFSKLLRQVLSNSRSEVVSLSDEMEVIRLYCALEALRFGKKFDYHFDIEEEIVMEAIQLPPMIIQPFVENAIWHGLLHKETGNRTLTIAVYAENEDVFIRINDNGIGRQAAQALKQQGVKKQKSFGIKITEERFHWFEKTHNQAIKFDIEDLLHPTTQEPEGTEVTIRLYNAKTTSHERKTTSHHFRR